MCSITQRIWDRLASDLRVPIYCAFFALVSLSGCSLTPTPPLSIQSSSGFAPVDLSTFSVAVQPAPGRSGVLRGYEREFLRQMAEHGYQHVETGGDLLISLQLQRTGWVRDLSKPIETGRLVFRMKADGETLRVGRSGILSSNDLDFPREHTRTERVRLFLNDL